MARWAGRLLPRPVEAEVGGREADPLARLPVVVQSRRAEEIRIVLPATRHEQIRIEEAGVDDMHRWQQRLRLERRVDRWRHLPVGGGGGRGFDVGDERRAVILTGFGEMDLVPDPGGRALLGVMGVQIVGRADAPGGGRQLLARPPPQHPILDRVLLDPHPAQRLDDRDLAQPAGRDVRPNGREERGPVAARVLGQRQTRLRLRWEMVVVRAPTVAVGPSGLAMPDEPFQGGDCQRVQRAAQRLANQAPPG